ncbi:MAG TPA: PUA domain-containing protein [Candidatus Nanoarchaeia archaeon]|nr:PUA domain-containing protein [Candidatus Nanoarchaeia archaeon]
MKRTPLRSKEVNKELVVYGITLNKKDPVVLLEDDTKKISQKIILVNNQSEFFYYENKLIPTLKNLQRNNHILKQIAVDMGAVKFMVKGADLMRPGIVEIEPGFKKDDFIVIVDVNNRKPLAVGIALFSSEEIQVQPGGRVVKNIHYLGDEIWEI